MRFTLSLLVFVLVSCSTTTSFVVPKDTELYVYDQKISESNYSNYNRRPLTWGTAGGVKYRLVKDGKTVEEGTLKTKFRVVSIFWPPVALAYWPMGFASANYDFTKENPMVRPARKEFVSK